MNIFKTMWTVVRGKIVTMGDMVKLVTQGFDFVGESFQRISNGLESMSTRLDTFLDTDVGVDSRVTFEIYKNKRGLNFDTPNLYGKILAGPYTAKPLGIPGVKLAKEIEANDVSIDLPIPDFSIPDMAAYTDAIIKALIMLKHNKVIYVGCMGGIGRTGLFLAGLRRVENLINGLNLNEDEVAYIRSVYDVRAVETSEQVKFVENFNPYDVTDFLSMAKLI